MLALVGCSAAPGMTKHQELAWDRWEACKRVPSHGNVQVTRINPDGQTFLSYSERSAFNAVAACLKEERQKQRAAGRL